MAQYKLTNKFMSRFGDNFITFENQNGTTMYELATTDGNKYYAYNTHDNEFQIVEPCNICNQFEVFSDVKNICDHCKAKALTKSNDEYDGYLPGGF